MRLPRKPQYVRVELDADMTERPRTLTYHYLGKGNLRPGDRVCVNDGEYRDVFGTVLGRSRRYSGYTYGVRRVKTKTIQFTETVERTAEFEVA